MPQPLFIFGVSQRTGTHFLEELLVLHNECRALGGPMPDYSSRPEDHLFELADPLLEYVSTIAGNWRAEWSFDRDAEDLLLRELAAALGRFVVGFPRGQDAREQPRYVVTKTPSTRNLPLFVRTMAANPALVIVRDGRDVVESGHATWGQSRERWMRVWRSGVDSLFDALTLDHDRSLMVVRYEDLVSDLRPTMTRILEHLELAVDGYDWDAAETLPLRGSSTIRPQHGRVTWEPVNAPQEALNRRRSVWPPSREARFAHIAGYCMHQLGYDWSHQATGRRQVIDWVYDQGWSLASRARRVKDRLGAPSSRG